MLEYVVGILRGYQTGEMHEVFTDDPEYKTDHNYLHFDDRIMAESCFKYLIQRLVEQEIDEQELIKNWLPDNRWPKNLYYGDYLVSNDADDGWYEVVIYRYDDW